MVVYGEMGVEVRITASRAPLQEPSGGWWHQLGKLVTGVVFLL